VQAGAEEVHQEHKETEKKICSRWIPSRASSTGTRVDFIASKRGVKERTETRDTKETTKQ